MPSTTSTPRRAPPKTPQEYARLKAAIDRVLAKNPDLPANERAQLRRTSTLIQIHLNDPKLKAGPAPTTAPTKK